MWKGCIKSPGLQHILVWSFIIINFLSPMSVHIYGIMIILVYFGGLS